MVKSEEHVEQQAPFSVNQYKHYIIIPLEICASQPAQSMVNEPTRDAPDEHVRPTRKAAQNAQQLWLCVD